YTPDLHVTADYPKSPTVEYYIEAKGYLRAKERALLRAFYKAHPDAPVRYLLQRDFPAGAKSKRTGERSSIVQWFHKFLPNAKLAIWSGNVPTHWNAKADVVALVDKTKPAKVQRKSVRRVAVGKRKKVNEADGARL